MRTRSALFLGGIFFLIGAAFASAAGYVGYGGYAEERQLRAEGQVAHAKLLHKAIRADRTRGAGVKVKYRVEYRFVAQRGEQVLGAADIARTLWQRLSPGDVLEVTYLSSDPSVRRVEGEEHEWLVPAILGGVGLVFAAIGAWLLKQTFAPSPPPATGPGAVFAGAVVRHPALVLGAIGVLFFLPFAAGGSWWLAQARAEDELFANSGRRVEGMVVSKAIVTERSGTSSSGPSRTRRQSTHYRVEYRFGDDAGTEVVGTSELGSGDWERLRERGPIAIVYVSGSPWLHRVGDEGGAWIAPLAFLAVGALGMLGSGGAAAWGWRRRGTAPPRATGISAPRAAPPAHGSGGTGNWIAGGAGAIFFAAGGALAVSGALDLLEERRFDADGRFVEARLTGKSIEEAKRGGRRSTGYFATYRFTLPSGESFDGRASLAPTAWEAAKAGDPLRVQFLAQRPQSNRPAGESKMTDAVVGMLVGPPFALIGAGLLYGFWRSRRRARAA